MELNTAYKEGFENPQSCLGYLGQDNVETCTHPSFPSIILAKSYSGMSMAAYLLSGMMLLWDQEVDFLRFMSCLSLSPVATTAIATIFSQQWMEREGLWHLLLVATVLYTTIAPQNVRQFPFITDRQFSPKTMQSMVLMGILAVTVWEITQVVLLGPDNMANSLLVTSSRLPEAAQSLVYFWIVDKLSMALLYLFALVHLATPMQSAFLFFVALIKGWEFFIQINRMDEPFHNTTMVQATTFASAIASAVARYW
jgi:hypothetical protein